MPVVPYDLPTVAPESGVSFFRGDFNVTPMENMPAKQGEAQSQAILKAGVAMKKISDSINYEIAEAKTRDRDNMFSDNLRQSMLEYNQKIGKEAVDTRADVEKKIDDLLTQSQDEIEDPLQREMFRNVAFKRMQIAKGEINSHYLKQVTVYDIGSRKARIENFATDAAKTLNISPNDWERKTEEGKAEGPFNLLRKNFVAEVEGLAKRLGYDKSQTKQYMSEQMSLFHKIMVDNYIANDNNTGAASYLKEFGSEISPDVRRQLNNLTKTGELKDNSLRIVMSLRGNETQQKATVDKMFDDKKIDAETRDAVYGRIDYNQQQKEQAQADFEKGLLGTAYDWVIKNPGKSITDMPTRMYSDLQRTGNLGSLNTYIKSNNNPQTDSEVYYRYREIAREDPSTFSKLDLMKVRDKLSGADWERLVSLQASISKADAKAMRSEQILKSTIGMIKDQVAAVGIDLTPKEGTKSAKETSKFLNAVSTALDEATEIKGSPLSSEEAKRIGENMLREGYQQGSGIFGFFTTKKRGYDIATDPRIKPGTSFIVAPYSEIPLQIRNDLLTTYLSKNGIQLESTQYGNFKVSDEIKLEIERAYTKGVQQGRFR
jgi:hypothetical protein